MLKEFKRYWCQLQENNTALVLRERLAKSCIAAKGKCMFCKEAYLITSFRSVGKPKLACVERVKCTNCD